MRILLTGATGFIGSAFARLSLKRGHEIVALARSKKTVPADLMSQNQLRWVEGELANAPWNELDAFRPEVCVHAAWISTPGVYLESPENFRHLEDGLKFLKRANEAGAGQIVGLGTCIEYQITNTPLSEDNTPIAPSTTYARCKNELRLALEVEAKRHGFGLCWGRVFYPYGVGEHPARLCTSIIQKLSRNEKIVLKTPNSTKDYIYIDDLAEAILTTVERKYSGAINLGTGVGVTVREIADTLGSLLGKGHLIEAMIPPFEDPLGFVVADASKLKSFGWFPQVSIKTGLRKLVSSLKVV